MAHVQPHHVLMAWRTVVRAMLIVEAVVVAGLAQQGRCVKSRVTAIRSCAAAAAAVWLPHVTTESTTAMRVPSTAVAQCALAVLSALAVGHPRIARQECVAMATRVLHRRALMV